MNLNLSKSTTELLIVICLVGAIPVSFFLSWIPSIIIFMSAANAALLIFALYRLGLTTQPVNTEKNEPSVAIAPTVTEDLTPETRTAQEIINAKLQGGAIEKAIDEQFDKMVQDVVKDLFGNYGGISGEIRAKLKETMNPYIEKYDFSQHNTKLELLLNEIIVGVTKEQTQIIANTRQLLGLDPIGEIATSKLFDKYCEYIGEEIETDKLEVNTDDEPSYEHLTAAMTVDDVRSYGSDSERKLMTFTCEQDDKLNMEVELLRWKDISKGEWKITKITRPNRDRVEVDYVDQDDLTDLKNPISALKTLDDLDILFIRLHQDRASIIIDEENIEDEDVEVKAEPEISFS